MLTFRQSLLLSTGKAALLIVGFVFICYVNGAVPGFAIPTLLQAVGTTVGWAQAFVNDGLFAIHSTNFGYPEPAARSFGLAGVLVTGIFLRLGVNAPNAYALMVVFWLGFAYGGAYKIAREMGGSVLVATLSAISWASQPIVWAHAGYSMLSLGIALLPFYFLALIQLLDSSGTLSFRQPRIAIYYLVACLIAVFMDGYTFMMFAVGSSIVLCYFYLRFPDFRSYLKKTVLPIHVIGFCLAYFLYAVYIGKAQFASAPIDFFRGWGVDLTFLALPSKGMHWIPDLLGWSVSRSSKEFFGDASVWITTFSLPLIAAASWAWWKTRKHRKIATGILLMAAFGFYMALGPSLKVNSVKPVGEKVRRTMPAEYAVAPTGSALLSENLPGFKNMRASYRWVALGVFGSWLLVVLLLSSGRRRVSYVAAAVIGFITLLNLPHLPQKWASYVKYREMFFQIDSDLLKIMEKDLHQNEKVAFLPFRNDLLVNYLAARLDIKSYNIGGDKNLREARKHWPETLRQFRMGAVDDGFVGRVGLLLASNEADAVVLPYIDMLWAAYRWPYPIQFKEELNPIVSELEASGFVDVLERKYYAIVRLNKEAVYLAQDGVHRVKGRPSTDDVYPMSVSERSPGLARTLGSGWYDLERKHVWSKESAQLRLPVPETCRSGECSVKLKFSVYGASQNRPVIVNLREIGPKSAFSQALTIQTSAQQNVILPLDPSSPIYRLSITIPDAVSPRVLQGKSDARVLGIALYMIELVRDEKGIYRSGFSTDTPTQVGVVRSSKLHSDGKQGFLLFGPYRPMSSGRYRLVVRGEGAVTDTAWVDVVSQKASIQHARFPLSSTSDGNKGVLAEGVVTLESPVKDVEVRVFVGGRDVVRLDGYELVPENLEETRDINE